MIFFLNLNGTCERKDTDHIYQGSNNTSKVIAITCISPAQTSLGVAFTLPNGLTRGYLPMQYKGSYQVGNDADNLMYLWELYLPYNVTEVQGTVGVSFNVVNSITGANLTSYTNTFEVEYSALPTPPSSASESELEQIINLLQAYYAQNTGIITNQGKQLAKHEAEITKQIGQISQLQDVQSQHTKAIQSLNSDVGDLVEMFTEQDTRIAENTKDIQAQGQTLQTYGARLDTHDEEIKQLQDTAIRNETYVGTLSNSETLPTAAQIAQYYAQNVGREPRGGDVFFFTQTSANGNKVFKYIYGVTGWSYYEIPSTAIGSNPNLLINPDFAINQRGQTSYNGVSGLEYGPDRWQLSRAGTLNIIAGGGISFTTIDMAGRGIKQYIENPSRLAGKTITISASVKVDEGGTLDFAVYYIKGNEGREVVCYTTTSSIDKTVISATGIVPSDITDSDKIYIMLHNHVSPTDPPANITFYAYWVKLEIGSAPTAFTPPNPAEELQECLYFFRRIRNEYGNSYQTIANCIAETNNSFRFVVEGKMRVVPTLTYHGNFSVVSSSNSNNVVTNISRINMSTIGTVVSATITSSVTKGEAGLFQINNDATAYIDLDAEF